MDKLALTGLALAVGGAVGVLMSELVGTAHAGRPGESTYLMAIGVSAPVKLVPMPEGNAGPPVQSPDRSRILVCRGGVFGFGALSVGYHCGAR